jgi:hypothetical protein
MAEVASSSKYIQCVVDGETFKRLKVEAIYQEKGLGDLLREIVEVYVENLDTKENDNG